MILMLLISVPSLLLYKAIFPNFIIIAHQYPWYLSNVHQTILRKKQLKDIQMVLYSPVNRHHKVSSLIRSALGFTGDYFLFTVDKLKKFGMFLAQCFDFTLLHYTRVIVVVVVYNYSEKYLGGVAQAGKL
ncbi:hypothetical protein BDC45DRAFT_537114 [Circinella umbellata]|nr:hypothetical protein BDC45DRAFT_537114 [Circinella umbellata]